MSKTKIEWCDEVINPVTGCTKVSAGCKNCYAEAIFVRFAQQWGSFNDLRFHPKRLTGKPITQRKKLTIFVNSMSDLFHERMPIEWQNHIFNSLITHNQHNYIILTKRPTKMVAILAMLDSHRKLREVANHIYFGVSIEDSHNLDRLAILRIASQKFGIKTVVSFEPLLGPIHNFPAIYKPDWIIIGCESGKEKRKCDIEWIRTIARDGLLHNIPVFVKQMIIDGKMEKNIRMFPDDLKIQMKPEGMV